MENFIAMDFETTGLVPWEHGPLSLGLVNDDIEMYVRMYPDGAKIDSEALRVNRFVPEEFLTFRNVKWVDIDVARELFNLSQVKGKFTAVGLNVGNFDMQFLNYWMPNTAKLFSHRPFDLNTMYRSHCPGDDWRDYRDNSTEIAMRDTGVKEENIHDAFSDALVAWSIFKKESGYFIPKDISPI